MTFSEDTLQGRIDNLDPTWEYIKISLHKIDISKIIFYYHQ